MAIARKAKVLKRLQTPILLSRFPAFHSFAARTLGAQSRPLVISSTHKASVRRFADGGWLTSSGGRTDFGPGRRDKALPRLIGNGIVLGSEVVDVCLRTLCLGILRKPVRRVDVWLLCPRLDSRAIRQCRCGGASARCCCACAPIGRFH